MLDEGMPQVLPGCAEEEDQCNLAFGVRNGMQVRSCASLHLVSAQSMGGATSTHVPPPLAPPTAPLRQERYVTDAVACDQKT